MRRTGSLVALTVSGLLAGAMAMAPSAGGLARGAEPSALTKHAPTKVSPCKPTFAIVSDKQFGSADTEAALLHVAEAGKKHAYAVGFATTNATMIAPAANGSLRGILATGKGKKWSFADHAGQSLKNVELLGVAATTNHNVWAVGFSFAKKNTVAPVVLHKTRSGWHSIHLRGSKPLVLESVMTSSPHDAYVGGVTEAKKKDVPIVLHYDGHRWHRTIFSSLEGFDPTDMTLAGHTPVVSLNKTEDGFNTVAESIIEYVKHGKWKTLDFPIARTLNSLSGTSIHNLWATSEDVNQDATVVFHHKKNWHSTTLADNQAAAVSERTPSSIWFAGQSTSTSRYALVDVLHDSSAVPASMEVSNGTSSKLADIDASVPNRVIAVGDDITATGSTPLIYQATC